MREVTGNTLYSIQRSLGWSATDISGAEDSRSALSADLDSLDGAYHISADGLPGIRLDGLILVLFRRAVEIYHSILFFRQGAAYLMFLRVVVALWLCALATPLYGMLIGREYEKATVNGQDPPGPETML